MSVALSGCTAFNNSRPLALLILSGAGAKAHAETVTQAASGRTGAWRIRGFWKAMITESDPFSSPSLCCIFFSERT